MALTSSSSSGGKIRIISADDVETRILPTITLPALLVSQATAFRSLLPSDSSSSPAAESAQCPARLSLSTPSHTQLFMPARTSSYPPASVVKIVSVPRPDSNLRIPSGIPGVNLLFDDRTGRVSHIVNSACLTALRTAAGSLLSSILAFGGERRKDVKRMIVYGDGAQALFHIWLHFRYFTAIEDVTVVVGLHRELKSGEVKEKEEQFKNQLDGLKTQKDDISIDAAAVTFRSASNPDEATAIEETLRLADIVCTCTPSTEPLFTPIPFVVAAEMPINDRRRRKHVIAVGSYKPHMCELPPELVLNAAKNGTLLVDSAEACAEEAGCLIQAFTANFKEDLTEIGPLLPETKLEIKHEGEAKWMEKLQVAGEEWRKSKDKGRGWLSVFKSVGVGLQDVEMTKLVVRFAAKDNIGTLVDF